MTVSMGYIKDIIIEFVLIFWDLFGPGSWADQSKCGWLLQYGDPPVSWFQKQIRGQEMILRDHISKEMNELNLERCKRIPKCPGADWRSLPDEKVLYPSDN